MSSYNQPAPPRRGHPDTFHYRPSPPKITNNDATASQTASVSRPMQGGMASAALQTSLATLAGAGRRHTSSVNNEHSTKTDNVNTTPRKGKPNHILLGEPSHAIPNGDQPEHYIHTMAGQYFSDREHEIIARREAYSRQTKMMLGAESSSKNEADSLSHEKASIPDRDDYLTLNSHQQRIVLQTNFRKREVHQASPDTRSHRIHIPVVSDLPPRDPFDITRDDDDTTMADPLHKRSYNDIRKSVRGFFDDLDSVDDQRQLLFDQSKAEQSRTILLPDIQEGSKGRKLTLRPNELSQPPSLDDPIVNRVKEVHAPAGFLNPNKLTFLAKRAEDLLRLEQVAQQARQLVELEQEEGEVRWPIPQQAERERMNLVAVWLKQFPPGFQLEMLAIQQRYFPSALSKPPNAGEGDLTPRRGGTRKTVIVDVPDGGGASSNNKKYLRKGKPAQRGKEREATNDGSSDSQYQSPSSKLRRRSSATRADIDDFFASLVGEGSTTGTSLFGRGRKGRSSKSKGREQANATTSVECQPSASSDAPLPAVSSVPVPNEGAPTQAVQVSPSTLFGTQVKEALRKVGVVYEGFTSEALYSGSNIPRHANAQPSNGATSPGGEQGDDASQDPQLVQFSAMTHSSSSRAHSLFTVPSMRPSDGYSDSDTRSSVSRSSPSIRSFSDMRSASSANKVTREELEEEEEDTETASASEGSKSRSNSRAASIASAFGAAGKAASESGRKGASPHAAESVVSETSPSLALPQESAKIKDKAHNTKVPPQGLDVLPKPFKPTPSNIITSSRKNPKLVAEAQTAAKRFSEQTHDSIRRAIEAELQSRMMCHWFGSPSEGLAGGAGTVAAAEGSSLLAMSQQTLEAPNAKPVMVDQPMCLLTERIVDKLSCVKEVETQVATQTPSQPQDPTPAPKTMADMIKVAHDIFNYDYERVLPQLIGRQLAFATETCATQAEMLAELSDNSKTNRPGSAASASQRSATMREALANAIDTFRVAELAAACALAHSKATGLKKAFIASQAAAASSTQAGEVVSKMLDVVLPSFLKPVQQEQHMLLLPESKTVAKGNQRHIKAKSSATLRPNPWIPRHDLFTESLLSEFFDFQKQSEMLETAQRQQLIGSGSDLAGLAGRGAQHGQASIGVTADDPAQYPNLKHLQQLDESEGDSMRYPYLRSAAAYSRFRFHISNTADIATIPFVLLGVTTTGTTGLGGGKGSAAWDTLPAQFNTVLKQLDTLVGSILPMPIIPNGEEDSLAGTLADVLNSTATPTTVNSLMDIRKESLNQALKLFVRALPLRMLTAMREEQACQTSLKRLTALGVEVVVQRHAAALTALKRELRQNPSSLISSPSVSLGQGTLLYCNAAIIDSLLTATAADLFYSSLAKHGFSSSGPLHPWDGLRPLLLPPPLKVSPQELARSSYVHVIQQFNAYSPHGNAWLRLGAYTSQENRVLRLVSSKAHATNLIQTSSEGYLLGMGLIPFGISPFSTVSSSIASAMFIADEAAAELKSIQQGLDSIFAQRRSLLLRIEQLSNTLSTLNLRIMSDNRQNAIFAPSGTVLSHTTSLMAAAAARRMSVVNSNDFSSQSTRRGSYSLDPQVASYEQQHIAEVDRQKALDSLSALTKQLENLSAERDRALDSLCKAQSIAVVASCIHSAASSLCSPSLIPEVSPLPDVTAHLLPTAQRDKRVEKLHALSLTVARSRKGVQVPSQPMVTRLPSHLQLTAGMASSSASMTDTKPKDDPFGLSGERIIELAPRPWDATQYLLPYCRNYCISEAAHYRQERRQSQAAQVTYSGEDYLNDHGLVSGAVLVKVNEFRVRSSNKSQGGLVIVDVDGSQRPQGTSELEAVSIHRPLLPMVPVDPTVKGSARARGVRPNYLFAWRVSGMILRLVACKFMPVLHRVRSHHHILALQPEAAFIIQCAWRRQLQCRRIHARAAVRRIERFLYSKIQQILARRQRASEIVRRAMRLWYSAKQAKNSVSTSLHLMRDEIIRRRMQCMHARRILTQLKRLQEERTVLTDKCAMLAHRILSDERLEWRDVCQRVRTQFFDELAELLANETERECIRVIVGAEEEPLPYPLLTDGSPIPGNMMAGPSSDGTSSENDLAPELTEARRDSDVAFAFFKEHGRRLSLGDEEDEEVLPPTPSPTQSDATRRLPHKRGTPSRKRPSQMLIKSLVDALNPSHRRSVIELLGPTTSASPLPDRRTSVAAAESSLATWRRSRSASLFMQPLVDTQRMNQQVQEEPRMEGRRSLTPPRTSQGLLSAAAVKLLKGHARLPRFSVVDTSVLDQFTQERSIQGSSRNLRASLWLANDNQTTQGTLNAATTPQYVFSVKPTADQVTKPKYTLPAHVVASPILLHHYQPKTLLEHSDTGDYVRELLFGARVVDVATLRRRKDRPAMIGGGDIKVSEAASMASDQSPPSSPVDALQGVRKGAGSTVLPLVRGTPKLMRPRPDYSMSLDCTMVARNVLYPTQQLTLGVDCTDDLQEWLGYPPQPTPAPPSDVSQIPQHPFAGNAQLRDTDLIAGLVEHPIHSLSSMSMVGADSIQAPPTMSREDSIGSDYEGEILRHVPHREGRNHKWCRAEDYIWVDRAPMRGWDAAATPYCTPTTTISRFLLRKCGEPGQDSKESKYGRTIRRKIVRFALGLHPQMFFPISISALSCASHKLTTPSSDFSDLLSTVALDVVKSDSREPPRVLQLPPAGGLRMTTAAKFGGGLGRVVPIISEARPNRPTYFPFMTPKAPTVLLEGFPAPIYEDSFLYTTAERRASLSFADTRTGILELMLPELVTRSRSNEDNLSDLFPTLLTELVWACTRQWLDEGTKATSKLLGSLNIYPETTESWASVQSHGTDAAKGSTRVSKALNKLGHPARSVLMTLAATCLEHASYMMDQTKTAEADEGRLKRIVSTIVTTVLKDGPKPLPRIPYYDVYSDADSCSDVDEAPVAGYDASQLSSPLQSFRKSTSRDSMARHVVDQSDLHPGGLVLPVLGYSDSISVSFAKAKEPREGSYFSNRQRGKSTKVPTVVWSGGIERGSPDYPLQTLFPELLRIRDTLTYSTAAKGTKPQHGTGRIGTYLFDYIPLSKCSLPEAQRPLRQLLERTLQRLGSTASASHSPRGSMYRVKSKLKSFKKSESEKVGADDSASALEVTLDAPIPVSGSAGPTINGNALEDAYIELLCTSERIERKQLEASLLQVLDNMRSHVSWHMAVLFLMENTRLEIVDGGDAESRFVSHSPYNLKSIESLSQSGNRRTANTQSHEYDRRANLFSTSLIVRTVTGLHPIFATGGVLPSLRPMWVLKKGFSLLQEEYMKRCSIIMEYEQTPLVYINSRAGYSFAGMIAESEYKAHSRRSGMQTNSAMTVTSAKQFEPRRPSMIPPTFRGRNTSVVVDPLGARRVSLLPNSPALDSADTARRPSARRHSVVSTGSGPAVAVPLVAPDRIYRQGISSSRPYLDENSSVHRTSSFASSALQSDGSAEDPFAKFAGNPMNNSRRGSIDSQKKKALDAPELRRRSTMKEKQDEYNRRISLMSEGAGAAPPNRRGTMQFTDESNLKKEVRKTRQKRATIRDEAEKVITSAPAGAARMTLTSRLSLSGSHHPFGPILHQQVSGNQGAPKDQTMENRDTDSGASTPTSQRSPSQSLLQGDPKDGGARISINSLLFAPAQAHQQPLAFGGTISPASFYAPTSTNVTVPSARSRRMTTAEADLLFPVTLPQAFEPTFRNSRGNAVNAQTLRSGSGSSEADSSVGGKSAPKSSSIISPRHSGHSGRSSVNSPVKVTSGIRGVTHIAPGTREALHEQLKAFRFRQSLAGPTEHMESVPLSLPEDDGEGNSRFSGSRTTSVDQQGRLSGGSVFLGTRESDTSTLHSTRMSMEEDQQVAELVSRRGKDYTAQRLSTNRRLTVFKTSGSL